MRTLGLALPGVEEGTAYGTPALKVRGRMSACVPSNRAAEPQSLVVVVPIEMRDELIDAEPAVYYVKAHYEPYPCVLVRLAQIHRDALGDLLRAGHAFVAARAGRRRSTDALTRRGRRAG